MEKICCNINTKIDRNIYFSIKKIKAIEGKKISEITESAFLRYIAEYERKNNIKLD